MDKGKLLMLAGVLLALFVLTRGGELPGGGSGGNGGNGGGTQTVTVSLDIQGGGQARIVIDGTAENWTSTGYTRTVEIGRTITIDTQADSGYNFDHFEGDQPPYTT